MQPDSQNLYDNAACGLLLTTRDGSIIRANQTFCAWTGNEAADLLGHRRLQDLLTMGGKIFHQTHWLPLLQMQGSVAEVQLDVMHRNGQTIPMLMNAVRREHEGITYHELAVTMTVDRRKYERELLRARKRAEELLLKQQQAQSFAEQMIGIVSHDLRNPLSAILMSAYLLGRGELTAQQIRVISRITNSANRAHRMIADLLDFTLARVGSGLTVNLKSIDLHEVVIESIDELALAYPGRKLERRQAGSGECLADADRLSQLIGNLVSNAMAYGTGDTPVTVSSSVEADHFVLSVHNHGTPIPPRLLPTLFEPMTRGDTGSRDGRSVGLGLFIVREIASAHGGTVAVTSSADAGTLFTATFPRTQAGSKSTSSAPSAT